jgi:glycosyltransferase
MKRRKIHIFNATSRGAKYGIGTYIDNLIEALKESDLEFVIIHLRAQGNEVEVTEKEGYKQISIPFPPSNLKNALDYYNRNVVYLLREFIPKDRNTEYVFQLNFMENEVLIKNLKKAFRCKIISAIHYMDWNITLNGDYSQLKRCLGKDFKSLEPFEKSIVKSFKNDLKMLKKTDRIVCLAQHTCNILLKSGGLNPQKMEIVNNAIKDRYTPLTQEEKQQLRKKYFIGKSEKMIVFAGRLDIVKGLYFIIAAFKKVLEKHPDTRLFIAGDGDFGQLLKASSGCWSKINFTGRLDRKQLFELYSIADMGAIASLYEEFPYVALEMVMHALPLVSSDAVGLDEIVEDGITGLKIKVRTWKNQRIVDVKTLSEKMEYMLENPEIARTLGDNARKRFLEKYELSLFREKMLNLYKNI